MRTAFGRGLMAVALVAGVAGLTAACGGDGSTVSSTPSASAGSGSSASADGSASATASSTVDPSPTKVAPTAPGETREAVPEGFPGPAAPERSDRDKAFLEGLTEEGIEFSQNGDVALSAAQFICSAERESGSTDQVRPMVLAIVASDAQLLDKEIDAEAVADVYIATAQETYCDA